MMKSLRFISFVIWQKKSFRAYCRRPMLVLARNICETNKHQNNCSCMQISFFFHFLSSLSISPPLKQFEQEAVVCQCTAVSHVLCSKISMFYNCTWKKCIHKAAYTLVLISLYPSWVLLPWLLKRNNTNHGLGANWTWVSILRAKF